MQSGLPLDYLIKKDDTDKVVCTKKGNDGNKFPQETVALKEKNRTWSL